MLFCQLGRADSLREICNGLGCCLGRLVHVGILRAPCRSTLSYANEHRPAALFEDLFFTALARFRGQQGLGADSDDVDQSFRSHADQIGAKRRRALSV